MEQGVRADWWPQEQSEDKALNGRLGSWMDNRFWDGCFRDKESRPGKGLSGFPLPTTELGGRPGPLSRSEIWYSSYNWDGEGVLSLGW